MKESLLPHLICPACTGELRLSVSERDARDILSGELQCQLCRKVYPIERGVPRFVDTVEISADKQATAKNFGEQWLEFDHVSAHHEQQFLDWIAPVTPDFVRGKTVVEGGCGKGRHTRLIAEWGAQAIIGIDLSDAVEAAFQNTSDLDNAHIIQADIYKLPLRAQFDYAFSVGVLHHLPDPRGGFASLVKTLKPGGAISAWVYGRENNGWIVHFINPLREHVTSKLPPRLLYFGSLLPSLLLFLALRLVYAPLSGTRISRHLFYAEYLGYIARFPFREIHNIVHDHLTAPTAFYIRREEFAEWFASANAQNVLIEWHNRNSWRGFAQIGAEPVSSEPQEQNSATRAEMSYGR